MSEQMMNNSGSEEVSGNNTNQNERGISVDTNNDQQTQNNNKEEESNMTNTPKTRGPYDGGYSGSFGQSFRKVSDTPIAPVQVELV